MSPFPGLHFELWLGILLITYLITIGIHLLLRLSSFSLIKGSKFRVSRLHIFAHVPPICHLYHLQWYSRLIFEPLALAQVFNIQGVCYIYLRDTSGFPSRSLPLASIKGLYDCVDMNRVLWLVCILLLSFLGLGKAYERSTPHSSRSGSQGHIWRPATASDGTFRAQTPDSYEHRNHIGHLIPEINDDIASEWYGHCLGCILTSFLLIAPALF